MSLRKVTRKGETRAGEKAIREYRRKKQQRRGGRESNRKIEIPSARAGEERFLLRGIFRARLRDTLCFIKRIGFRELFHPDDEY